MPSSTEVMMPITVVKWARDSFPTPDWASIEIGLVGGETEDAMFIPVYLSFSRN